MKPAVRRLLTGRSGPSVRSVSNGNPLYLAHRGCAYLGPENTLAAFENVIGYGAQALEYDIHALSDGGLAIMHDTTVDRTTTGTGLVSSFTTAGWKALAIDAAAQNVPGWGDAVSPPLLHEVLSLSRGRAISLAEIKVASTKQAMVDAFLAAGIRKDQAVIQSFGLSDVAPAVAAGYTGCILLSVAAAALSANVTSVQAAGVKWCAIDDTAPDSSFTMWVNAGFTVLAYTVNRRARRDQLLALGVAGFISDDAPYLAGYRTASSDYTRGKWCPGMFSMNTSTTAQTRGSINAGGWFGWADPAFVADIYRGTLQGWLGPMNSATFTLSFEARINAVNAADTTRWGAVFISDAAMKDDPYTNTNTVAQTGYNIVFRKNGTIEIFITGGGATTSIASSVNAGMAMADGVSSFFKITVTPTNIRFARTDSGGTELQQCNVNNSTYRGGYVHLGRDGALAEFRGVSVS